MKILRRIGMVMILVLVVSGLGMAFAAATVPAPAFELGSLWQALIPVGVPLFIALAKMLIPMLPGWLLPIIAPILGGLADAGLAYVSGGTANPVLGAILGSAGVGVREIVDQIKRAAAK